MTCERRQYRHALELRARPRRDPRARDYDGCWSSAVGQLDEGRGIPAARTLRREQEHAYSVRLAVDTSDELVEGTREYGTCGSTPTPSSLRAEIEKIL